jgi:DNA-binding transcriptional MerR regulator
MSNLRVVGPGGTQPSSRTTPTPSRALRETPRPSKVRVDELPAIPEKIYFRIGEVAELVGVEPHVLRYWEQEFRSVRPTKSQRGQRVYTRRDVEVLRRIRGLLYEEKFTIAGARKALRSRGVEPRELAIAPGATSVVEELGAFAPEPTPTPMPVAVAMPTPTPMPVVVVDGAANEALREVRAGLRELLALLDGGV